MIQCWAALSFDPLLVIRGGEISMLNYGRRASDRKEGEGEISYAEESKVKLTIQIADDHELIRQSVAALLSNQSDFEVLADCATARQLLKQVEQLRPAVVIIDVNLSGVDAIKTTRRISAISPYTRVIVLSAYADALLVPGLIAAGIAGYVLRSDPTSELIQAIRCQGNDVFLSSEVAALVKKEQTSNAEAQAAGNATALLSPRQRQVLRLIAQGYSSNSIAAKFGVSASTIKTHRKNIMEKLNIHDKVGLTRHAIRIGLTHANSGPLQNPHEGSKPASDG
jgi:DNA-binding NarL/FixJ family response regulator